MDVKKINVTIKREIKGDTQKVSLVIHALNNHEISFTDNTTLDIENFFDLIFQKVVKQQKLIEFILIDEGKADLFHEVAEDLLKQINSEIKLSSDDFQKIIELNETKHTILNIV